MADPARDRVAVWHTHPGRHLRAATVEQVARHVLRSEIGHWAEVGVILSRRDVIHQLNRDHLGHDWPTDVISFLLSGPDEPVEGEVYVDLDTAAKQAPEFGARFTDEALRYVIHGLLHLAGHDDATESERAGMRQLENRYLSTVL